MPFTSYSHNINGAVIVRAGVDFIDQSTRNGSWDQNSPLPPGTRYWEIVSAFHQLYKDVVAAGDLDFYNGHIRLIGFESFLLPRDSDGNVRLNAKSLGYESTDFNIEFYRIEGASIASAIDALYADDSFWTGEVVDPLLWQDDWWDQVIDKEAMALYLEAHPGCKLNA